MTDTSQAASARRLNPTELEFWKQRLHDIPDLRWDKVVSIRKAIHRDRYDSGQRINGTLAMLGNEVGVLCRRENTVLQNQPADPNQSSM